MNSFVSIVVPVRESNKDILNLLNKLELQTYHKFEVIIVDSSESINIKELIKPYFNNLNLIYKHVDKAILEEQEIWACSCQITQSYLFWILEQFLIKLG